MGFILPYKNTKKSNPTLFKPIKQNLQIKNFLGTNENSNKSQIFIALISYFFIELVRRSISNV
ncbi:MAG: hypothetical protein B6I19_11200 [Bacteroidetes bacterium 4572_114]|nr:MAG: hypothetical protein B6I19_11200 [Bacteroidetes bacterium 4572_114]